MASPDAEPARIDAPRPRDAAPPTADAKPFEDAATPPIDAAPPAPALTIKNYFSWCAISVNGGTPSLLPVISVPITMPATITLAATAKMGFQIGPTPWHDTAGDHGAGDPGMVTGTGSAAKSTTTVDVDTTSACVWACCPFATTGSGCPTADQCP